MIPYNSAQAKIEYQNDEKFLIGYDMDARKVVLNSYFCWGLVYLKCRLIIFNDDFQRFSNLVSKKESLERIKWKNNWSCLIYFFHFQFDNFLTYSIIWPGKNLFDKVKAWHMSEKCSTLVSAWSIQLKVFKRSEKVVPIQKYWCFRVF